MKQKCVHFPCFFPKRGIEIALRWSVLDWFFFYFFFFLLQQALNEIEGESSSCHSGDSADEQNVFQNYKSSIDMDRSVYVSSNVLEFLSS